MTAAPAPIQMLWFGRPLSAIEWLSIASFRAHGHPVHLYTYGGIGPVPDGTTVRDAAELLPAATFEELRARGVRPGVISDYFRALLLRDRGGWWSDCDVVCVRSFDFAAEIVFGWQDARVINNAVLRLPAGHPAAALLVGECEHPSRWSRADTARRRARKTRDALLGRTSPARAAWGATGPAAVTSIARRLRLAHHATSPEAFYPVPWQEARRLFEPGELALGTASFGVHLWNEVRGGREPAPGSPVAGWLREYDVAPDARG